MSSGWQQYDPEPILITIGDITVTPAHIVTPQGRRPVGGAYWTLTDMSRTTRVIPTWAIVLAVVFAFFFLLGLLFLLAREEQTEGWVQIAVQGEGLYHSVNLPVTSSADVARYTDMVGYARSVSASRPGW